ncbi:hypothetical protein ABT115_24160 [Streptomyces sp. NPDC001832]|uniref:hypothetical protein n=1 Tax=Streptomyces sp. NPDC001832 TaxID=3154527 RepID=UPI0033234797
MVSENRKTNPIDRRGIAAAGALLLACAGLVTYGILDTEERPAPRAVPTADVTYEVTGEGTADISYVRHGGDHGSVTVQNARLPWRATVPVPLGKDPLVSIVLGAKGGTGTCALAIRGQHVQSTLATGAYGRATCSGELPASG